MTREVNESPNTYYFNLCTSRHIYNNKHFFLDCCSKIYEFVIARKKIIRSDKVSIIPLPIIIK